MIGMSFKSKTHFCFGFIYINFYCQRCMYMSKMACPIVFFLGPINFKMAASFMKHEAIVCSSQELHFVIHV